MSRPDRTTDEAGRRHTPIVRLAALAGVIAGTVAAGHLLNAWMDPIIELREAVQRAGSTGPLLFIVAFLALNTVGVPMPVLGTVAGVAFGPVTGATTSLVAMTVAACVQFLLARHVAGARVRQRLGHRWPRVNHILERRGIAAVAGARLLPVPFSEFNMLAGLTRLSMGKFTTGTIIGCAPKAVVWSGLGALLF